MIKIILKNEMKDKSTFHIYLNNLISYILLYIYKIFLPKAKIGNTLLLINTGQIGDIVISSVLLNNRNKILSKYDKVFFLVKEEYSIILKSFDWVEIISLNKSKFNSNIKYRYNLLKKIRSIGIALCINLTAARGVSNDTIALLSGANKTIALNSNYRYLIKLFGKRLDKLYSKILARDINNEYKKHLEVLKFLGFGDYKIDTVFPIKNKTIDSVSSIIKFNTAKLKIVIAPFTDIPIKNWEIKKYTELINLLIDEFNDIIIFIFGSSGQKKAIEAMISIKSKRILNLAGEYNIMESAAILSKCNLFIGNDSGFTHIAKALKIPLVAIIGGGSNGYFIPYNEKPNESYLFESMDCFGCEWRCIHEEPYCLTNVSVNKVLFEVKRLLNENP